MRTIKVKIINQRKIHKVVRAVKRKVRARDTEYLKRKYKKHSLSRKRKFTVKNNGEFLWEPNKVRKKLTNSPQTHGWQERPRSQPTFLPQARPPLSHHGTVYIRTVPGICLHESSSNLCQNPESMSPDKEQRTVCGWG